MARPARVYVSRDSSRTTDEGQYYAEVIADAGEEAEAVLHTTGWHTSPHPAWSDAEDWMRANGVPEVIE